MHEILAMLAAVVSSSLGGISGATTRFVIPHTDVWSYALGRSTPTKTAVAITVNPVFAAIAGAILLREPIGWNLVFGVAAVLVGILLATTGKTARG